MKADYKAVIIDDEIRARKLLSGILEEYAPGVTIVADCEDLPSGIKAIRRHKPDLVFLDIEMPGHSGLELLDFFNEEEINFDIIFTTAYNQYAINAFKLSAIDYLLKPIDAEELKQAIVRFEKKKNTPATNMLTLRENLRNRDSSRIAVPSGNTFRFIELADILYLKADSSYTELFFRDGTKLVVSRTLKNFEETLNAANKFFRCHKSYMVNTAYITDYVKADGGYILLNRKINIPISAERVEELLENIKTINR